MKKTTAIINKFTLGGVSITWVIRHRWEKGAESLLENYEANKIRTEIKLGVWFKKHEAVAAKGFQNPEKWKLMPVFLIGMDLIVISTWLNISYGVKRLNIK